MIRQQQARRSSVLVLATNRLRLRKLKLADAGFILRLLNEPSFIAHIGDKGVRTLADARAYILQGPVASYAEFGFGLWLVETKANGVATGLCGLLQRATLADVDIGYAFLPEFWGCGYALEAATGVLTLARDTLGLQRVVAVTSVDNQSSIRLLEKIGFQFERMISLADGEPEIKLFAKAL